MPYSARCDRAPPLIGAARAVVAAWTTLRSPAPGARIATCPFRLVEASYRPLWGLPGRGGAGWGGAGGGGADAQRPLAGPPESRTGHPESHPGRYALRDTAGPVNK